VASGAMDSLPTAAVADACVRLKVPARAVVGVHPVLPGRVVAGPVLPVQHAGSVDVFFEALQAAKPGQVLCIDNGGRPDEGCIGDLTALEAMHHGCAAILVDGAHRDTSTLRSLGLPVWSRGTSPVGPLAARPRPGDALEAARIGGHRVTAGDVVALDDDGAVFVPAAQAARVWELAARIQSTEAEQARLARSGQPLCEQFQVKAFLAARKVEPTLGFRAHLRSIGKAIEE
jgi:4-hydroxy-4-methyl-2-oxoglutarate aldolase